MNPPSNPLINHTITIDGPTASGKGTLAKRLSSHYKAKYLDTGTLYRALTWAVLNAGIPLTDTPAIIAIAQKMDFDFRHIGNNQFATFMNGESVERLIRTPEVDKAVTPIATNLDIRAALLNVQKEFVKTWAPQYGVILDGRDTGARIAPNALAKLFIVGDPKIRADRRMLDFQARGLTVNAADVEADLIRRDTRDAPNTIQTEDAIVLDATAHTPDEMEALAVAAVEAVLV